MNKENGDISGVHALVEEWHDGKLSRRMPVTKHPRTWMVALTLFAGGASTAGHSALDAWRGTATAQDVQQLKTDIAVTREWQRNVEQRLDRQEAKQETALQRLGDIGDMMREQRGLRRMR